MPGSDMDRMKRGDVFLAHLQPRSGSEQSGRRPVVLISHDSFNEAPAWRSVVVIRVSTSAGQARRGPSAVPIPAGTCGLLHDSVALCHQITTLDRGKLTRRLGALSRDVLCAVEDGIRAAIDLDK